MLLRELGRAGSAALDPALLEASPCSPLFSSDFPSPGGPGVGARQLIPAFWCFSTAVGVSFSSSPPARLGSRGKREESSQAREKRRPGSAAEQKSSFGEDLSFALFLCAVRMNYLQGDAQPLSKLAAKEVTQPLGAPRRLRLLLLLGTRASGGTGKGVFMSGGTKLAFRGWKRMPGVIRKVGLLCSSGLGL